MTDKTYTVELTEIALEVIRGEVADNRIVEAANYYEIAETMRGIRFENPVAHQIADENFKKAVELMNAIADDYDDQYKDILEIVRLIVKLR